MLHAKHLETETTNNLNINEMPIADENPGGGEFDWMSLPDVCNPNIDEVTLDIFLWKRDDNGAIKVAVTNDKTNPSSAVLMSCPEKKIPTKCQRGDLKIAGIMGAGIKKTFTFPPDDAEFTKECLKEVGGCEEKRCVVDRSSAMKEALEKVFSKVSTDLLNSVKDLKIQVPHRVKERRTKNHVFSLDMGQHEGLVKKVEFKWLNCTEAVEDASLVLHANMTDVKKNFYADVIKFVADAKKGSVLPKEGIEECVSSSARSFKALAGSFGRIVTLLLCVMSIFHF